MICDTCKQRKVCEIQVSHVVNNGCRIHIKENDLSDIVEKHTKLEEIYNNYVEHCVDNKLEYPDYITFLRINKIIG